MTTRNEGMAKCDTCNLLLEHGREYWKGAPEYLLIANKHIQEMHKVINNCEDCSRVLGNSKSKK